MRIIGAGQAAVTALDVVVVEPGMSGLGVVLDRELVVGVRGESPVERAARLAALSDILDDLAVEMAGGGVSLLGLRAVGGVTGSAVAA